MDLSSKQRIIDFNQSDVVYTFKKLVSWRENGITFPVPESLRDYIKDPTDLKKIPTSFKSFDRQAFSSGNNKFNRRDDRNY